MSFNNSTGGQAFPYFADDCGEAGMTKLDLFAAFAMAAMLIREEDPTEMDADEAYEAAEKMVEARSRH